MIAKITRGDEMGGLVRYLLGPGRANEHTGMRVVAAGTGIDVAVGETLSDELRRHLVDQLDGPYPHGRLSGGGRWPPCGTSAYPSGDRKLSDQEWGDAVRTVMRALDFDDGRPGGRAPAPWVTIHHGASTAGNDHVHVAVSLVREDGARASNWRDRVKASAVCRELEERYGLTVVDGRTAGSKPGVTRGDARRPSGWALWSRTESAWERLVRASASSSRDDGEFVRRLRSDGVCADRATPRTPGGWWWATRWPPAGSVLTSPGTSWPGPGSSTAAARRWWAMIGHEVDKTLGSLRRRRRRLPGGNVRTEAISVVRRARRHGGRGRSGEGRSSRDRRGSTCGGYRCGRGGEGQGRASRRAALREGDRPGALAAAADMLARSAQKADHRQPRRTDMAGLATVAAQAVLVYRGAQAGSAGWLLVAAEPLRLAQAVRARSAPRDPGQGDRRLAPPRTA